MPRPRAPKPELLSLYHLTAREREILEAVAQGLDNDGIARGLNISEKTVRNDVSTVMSKLGVTSRSQTIVRARGARVFRPLLLVRSSATHRRGS